MTRAVAKKFAQMAANVAHKHPEDAKLNTYRGVELFSIEVEELGFNDLDDLDELIEVYIRCRYGVGPSRYEGSLPSQRYIVIQHGLDRAAARSAYALGGSNGLYVLLWSEDDRIGPIEEA